MISRQRWPRPWHSRMQGPHLRWSQAPPLPWQKAGVGGYLRRWPNSLRRDILAWRILERPAHYDQKWTWGISVFWGVRILGRFHRLKRASTGATLDLDMRSYAIGIVEFYCGFCGIEMTCLKRVPSPALPESSMTHQEAEEQGVIHNQASEVLMRLLWLSRFSRPWVSLLDVWLQT